MRLSGRGSGGKSEVLSSLVDQRTHLGTLAGLAQILLYVPRKARALFANVFDQDGLLALPAGEVASHRSSVVLC
jgi:hypothetical protein